MLTAHKYLEILVPEFVLEIINHLNNSISPLTAIDIHLSLPLLDQLNLCLNKSETAMICSTVSL